MYMRVVVRKRERKIEGWTRSTRRERTRNAPSKVFFTAKKMHQGIASTILDTSGIEPDTSRMLSERDKPTTPCAHVLERLYNVHPLHYITTCTVLTRMTYQ